MYVQDYQALIATLDHAAGDPDVAVVAVTGEGDYFTAGNDFIDNLQNMGLVHSPAGLLYVSNLSYFVHIYLIRVYN